MQIKEFQSEENAGERIDKFLTEKVPELSRSYIQKLIKEKNVKVNSAVIKSNYKVAKGDQIRITIPDLTEPDILFISPTCRPVFFSFSEFFCI